MDRCTKCGHFHKSRKCPGDFKPAKRPVVEKRTKAKPPAGEDDPGAGRSVKKVESKKRKK